MTALKSTFNTNTIVVSICTFIILAALGWVGNTASSTHDTVIALEVKQAAMEVSMTEVRSRMLTRTDLSVELLKLQIPTGVTPKNLNGEK